MRVILAAAYALLVAGCDRPEVKGCEGFIKDSLRSPATYQRVSATSEDRPSSPAEIRKLGGYASDGPTGLGLRIVTIVSDAANAYGTPVRSTEQCAFQLDRGNLDEDGINSRVTMAKSQRVLHSMMAAGAIPGVSAAQAGPEKRYPCCV